MKKKFFSKTFLYVIILAIASRISLDIPFTSINITAQTLALLTMVCIFPFQITMAGIFLYLIIGIIGLPVFSNGNSSWEYFLGPSFGYFIGFVLSSIIIGSLVISKKFNPSILFFILIHLLGTTIILFNGTLFLNLHTGMSLYEAFTAGLLPFILPGFIKSFIGGIASYWIIHSRN